MFTYNLHTGLPLYMASSVFIRHTLKTLYSDLHVELRRVYVIPQAGGGSGASGVGDDAGGEGTVEREEGKKTPSRRDKSLFVGLVVRGTARVSGAVGEWEVSVVSYSILSIFDYTNSRLSLRNATYTFSPITGLIHIHTINSIHPAPHQAAYDALRSSLGRVLGLAGGGVAQRHAGRDGCSRRTRGRGGELEVHFPAGRGWAHAGTGARGRGNELDVGFGRVGGDAQELRHVPAHLEARA